MEGIEFDKENYRPLNTKVEEPKKSWAVSLMTKVSGGRIKTEAEATVVWAIVIVILISLSIYNFASSARMNVRTTAPTREQLAEMQNMMNPKTENSQGN